MILVAMFPSGVLLYILGSVLEQAERRKPERELEELHRRLCGPGSASRGTSATPTRGAGR